MTADIFSRERRALRRARSTGPRGSWFDDQMAEMLLDRLGDITRQFEHVLVIGARCPLLLRGLKSVPATANAQISVVEQSSRLAESKSAIWGDEDKLPVDPQSFDCILWPGGLESVNDVQGALLRCRLALKDDGLLLGCFAGDGSFPLLRSILHGSQSERIVARMQPQIDTRSLGDLLAGAGLSLAVTDTDRLTLSYATLSDLVADLRAAAWTNMLAGEVHPFSRAELSHAIDLFDASRNASGRCVEQLRLVHFSAWAPHRDQPRPARRGSGTISLTKALGGSSTDQAAR